MTAQEWRGTNPKKKGNQRDHATLLELMVLGAMEVLDSKLIAWGCDQQQRLDILTDTAKEYLQIIPDSKAFKQLNNLTNKQKKLKP